MKIRKNVLVILFILTLVLISACSKKKPDKEPESPNENICISDPENALCTDKINPMILFDNSFSGGDITVTVEQFQPYDPLTGVTAKDNLEGDITDRIIVFGLDDFDPNTPGEYSVRFTVYDTAGNQAPIKEKIIIVKETYRIPVHPSVYTGEIENEAPLDNQQTKCFGGAWYYKVLSSNDYWLGIETEVTLPTYQISKDRYLNSNSSTTINDITQKNLDNPSIYLGGHASSESDVGLSLSVGTTTNDSSDPKIPKGSFVFRPFWRYITSSAYTDEGGYNDHNGNYSVSCSGSSSYNCIANWHFMDTQYYYLPGDTVRMIVYSPKKNYLQLIIEVVEISTLKESQETRAKYGWKDPETFYSPYFRSEGQGHLKSTFKHVNAIDQANNEGGVAINTTTEVHNAVWQNVYLYRKIDGELRKVPMTSSRSSSIGCPYEKAFTVTNHNEDKGGMIIDIHPAMVSTANVLSYAKKRKED